MAINGPATTPEGSAYQFTLDPVSPNVPVSGYTIRWGDGVVETFAVPPDTTTVHEHRYADGPTDPTIAVDLVAGGVTFAGAGRLPVAVTDVAPTSP